MKKIVIFLITVGVCCVVDAKIMASKQFEKEISELINNGHADIAETVRSIRNAMQDYPIWRVKIMAGENIEDCYCLLTSKEDQENLLPLLKLTDEEVEQYIASIDSKVLTIIEKIQNPTVSKRQQKINKYDLIAILNDLETKIERYKIIEHKCSLNTPMLF